MKAMYDHAAGDEACEIPHYRPYFPFATLKCSDHPVFRLREARSYACLLDLDPNVVSWQGVPFPLTDDRSDRTCFVDFIVETAKEHLIVDVSDKEPDDKSWLADLAGRLGYRYEAVLMSALVEKPRLQNAKDLIRYAGYDAPLGDRIRILAALEEQGTLTLAECLGAVRDGKQMQTIAALILKGHIEVDLDEALLGPDTVVRRPSR
jgi:hypothetical protein